MPSQQCHNCGWHLPVPSDPTAPSDIYDSTVTVPASAAAVAASDYLSASVYSAACGDQNEIATPSEPEGGRPHGYNQVFKSKGLPRPLRSFKGLINALRAYQALEGSRKTLRPLCYKDLKGLTQPLSAIEEP